MKFKAILPTLLAAIMLSAFPVNAASKISVKVDDKNISFTDAQPVIVDSRTMVPVRGVFEQMKFSISWNQSSRTAVLSNSKFIIQVSESGITATSQLSGKNVSVDNSTLPQIINNRFYMPLRAIAQCSGSTVDWDSATKTVTIVSSDYTEKLEALEKQRQWEEQRANSKVTSPTEEESDGSAYFNPEGQLSLTDQTYLNTVFDGLEQIRQIAIDQNDPVLLRFYGLGDTSKEIVVSNTDYSQVETICNALTALQPTANLVDVDSDVKTFVSKLKLAYQQTKLKKITQTELTKTINSFCKERAAISQEFSQHLYTYFTSKQILFEKVFGENCLDAMN